MLNRTRLVILGLFFLNAFVNPGYETPDLSVYPAEGIPAFLKSDTTWADSVMETMSLEQRIGQMLMIEAYSNRDASHLRNLEKEIRKTAPGGVIFFQGDPVSQALMTNRLQSVSKVPLLIAMDAEWGLGMRLQNTISYPRQMMLGAIQDNDVIFRMGKAIGYQMSELGIHMNFAPVADVNNNPANPVINTRSFGEERENVAAKVNAYFHGLQNQNRLVTAKHFPGHGDTDTDSHHALPVIPHSMHRLDSVELFPFRHAIRSGISGIMVAHLHVPAIDSDENRPTTLSKAAVDSLLSNALKFEGLIVTDALNMKGVADFSKPGELEVEAVKAGNDILLIPEDPAHAVTAIKRAVRKGDISEERINHSCRKILLAKRWSGADRITPIETKGLEERLNSRSYLALQQEISEKAMTLLRDRDSLVPVIDLPGMKYAALHFGAREKTVYSRHLDKYRKGDHFYFEGPLNLPDPNVLSDTLRKYNTLIISLYYTRSYGNNFDIPPEVIELIQKIQFEGTVILNHFGYPYALDVLGNLNKADVIMVAYTNDTLNQKNAAHGLFGGIPLKGKLPVSTRLFPVGTGITTSGPIRLKYTFPEYAGMNYDTLQRIDRVIQRALQKKAMPGCQVLVARKGQVIWEKAYGHHTYRRRRQVTTGDIYDLASITKIASTIPSLMKLLDEGRFDIDSTLGAYIPELDTSQKAELQIRDILTHQAGFEAWIPFYTSTLEPLDTAQELFDTRFSYTYPYKMGPAAYANRNIVYKDSVYSHIYTPEYPVQVADNMFMRSDYRDSVYMQILRSPLGEKTYKYSDLGYYYFFRMIEDLTDTLFYPFTYYNFYGPLGAETLGFLPLNRFPANRIVPTENDLIFRRQVVHGHVHDPGAAMLGGVCGHAGLFSNANDLAKLMQMYLNKGVYGGRRYIDSATIAEFTRCQYCDYDNRRALGFDRPVTDEPDAGPACNSASDVSYGHSGFTGTLAWVDPKYDLVYIFLSNRIHPDQYNTRLISLNVRTDVQQILYNSLIPENDTVEVTIVPEREI